MVNWNGFVNRRESFREFKSHLQLLYKGNYMKKMTMSEAGKLGGIIAHRNALKRYEANPNKCICCNKDLDYKHRYNKFCNSSCAATYNNTFRKKISYCKNCGKKLNKHRKSYCNNICQQEYVYKQYIKKWKDGLETGLSKTNLLSQHIRKYIKQKFNNKCAKCGWHEINPVTGKVPLEIDHIDGNYLNNKENNLILLCPNCHSLTSTYKALNKGKGRKFRK